MTVIRFELNEFNLLEINERRYVLIEDQNANYRFISADCPHKGGPLYLGRMDSKRAEIQCPWHDNRFPLKTLCRKSLPMIQNGNHLCVVVAGKNSDVYVRKVKTLLGSEK